MADKVFCDPVYQHIVFDKSSEALLLDLIACPEVQRLRRVRQLGVSSYTYPGAEHSRFGHALGTCHLMGLALAALQRNQPKPFRLSKKDRLAARCAALLHDIGHGPFSHLTERALGLKHERTTRDLILKRTQINRVLKSYSPAFPKFVSSLLDGTLPRRQFISDLLSSQLDVDRMDYLLRDAYFCGVSFGVYDYLRILHTMRIERFAFDKRRHPVWLVKGEHSVEEFLYARFFMYWTVYYHKTTRGFEVLFEAILKRALEVADLAFLPGVRALLAGNFDLKEFVSLDDTVVLAQIREWAVCSDRILADLCTRFLGRDGFKPIGPVKDSAGMEAYEAVQEARGRLRRHHRPPEFYFLESTSVTTAYDYYRPEEETRERSQKNSIMLADRSGRHEISTRLEGVRALTKERNSNTYWYVPREHADELAGILGPFVEE